MNKSQPLRLSLPDSKIERRRIHVDGVVQGVGFRPFVFGLADRWKLAGWVLNSSSGVDIEVQGPSASLDSLETAISAQAPRLARIDRVSSHQIPVLGNETGFVIRHSQAAAGVSLISPDVATCPDCLKEILDPADRRFRYPFTNCTNCGPRYTIIQNMPYDRPMTTMSAFKMCPACQAEYENPLDRRFHAQPNACPTCGPQVQLVADEPMIQRITALDLADDIARAAALLVAGSIVAVKGIGGFHLVCDATNSEIVERLRARKNRPDKPFAVMMGSLDEIRAHCEVSPEEESLLTSVAAPILLLYRRAESSIASNVAPANPMLGVMLPYTPLHHILLRDAGRPLVMTSGNLSEMPILAENVEAQHVLSDIADAFLIHDRAIHMRCDDAVWWVDRFAGQADSARQPLRRSRGDAPYPVRLPWSSEQGILGTGAEMKNTLCLLRGSDAFLSQHIGEIDSLEALNYYRETLGHLAHLFKIEPQVVAHDLHPDYRTTRLAQDLAAERGLQTVGVQHHHAHIAACLAEHGMSGRVIGIALDGTGYGTDGAIWGGEILTASVSGFERVAHLEYLPLPGGEAAIHRPYRIAWGYLLTTLGSVPSLPALSSFSEQEKAVVARQIERGINSPVTSSCGRLFDAVAAMLGVCTRATFEAQPAISLELAARAANLAQIECYPLHSDEDGIIRVGNMLAAITSDLLTGRALPDIAAAFHITLAAKLVEMVRMVHQKTALDTVALSGGVFQNRLLLRLIRDMLRESGFQVLSHRQVPANDGGLSLGQAVVALHKMEHR